MAWTTVQLCGLVSVLCGAWNLFGDLAFMDFYHGHMTFEGFGTIRNVSRPGALFNFNRKWPLQVAQASGWMYPVWAITTAYPLYLGLSGAGWWCSMVPCAVLAYGLCVVGGALHSGFAFATIIPQILHLPRQIESTAGAPLWKPMGGSPACAGYMKAAQAEVMEAYVFGYTPGPLSVVGASFWIAYVVATRRTKFPKWFILCTPLVTLINVMAVGFLVIHDPWNRYFIGTFGTWIILVMNLATSYVLWDVDEDNEDASSHKS